eukprot:Tbor_TRINITY_DN6018_c1_g1::TRINITY_DN6018_c1_g1_i10::g.10169::m.10169
MYLQHCVKASLIIATDGSCNEVQTRNSIARHCTSAYAVWLNPQDDIEKNNITCPTIDTLEKPLGTYSRNAGQLASSYRAEQIAIQTALHQLRDMFLVMPNDIQKRQRPVLLTDSLSVL